MSTKDEIKKVKDNNKGGDVASRCCRLHKEHQWPNTVGLVSTPSGVEGQPMEHFDGFGEPSKLRGRENAPLTARERQIIVVLAEGLTNKEIGRRLKLAEGTVKVHLHRIYQKLHIANRTALAIRAHTVIL